jgi:hypothetical protein
LRNGRHGEKENGYEKGSNKKEEGKRKKINRRSKKR